MGELWAAGRAWRNKPMLPKGLVRFGWSQMSLLGRKSSERQKGGRMLIESIK